jgi:plasmid replication initiation protein
MRKINDFKINALKVERFPNIFENLNFFETMLKMIKKNDANVLKTYFLDFQCFSLFFDFSENLSKHG